jgi:hypothetical protein
MTNETKAVAALTSRIVAGAVANAAPHDEARDIVELLVSRNVKVDDEGNIKIIDENGGHRISTRPDFPSMTLEEYIDEIKASRPTLFRSPGTSSTSTTSAQTEPNPFAAKTFNISKQMIMMRQDPARAARLEAEANQ